MRGIAIPRVTPGLPSELVAQRPDIRQAEANLAAANANVENARAQILPSITLTGEGGYQSAVLKTLLRPESAFYTATAGLTQPIFDGGKLLGNLDLQKGLQDQLLQNYRKAVISAFTDVDKALIAVRETAIAERLQARRGRRVRAAPSISPNSNCAPAPSIWSPCCRSSRRCSRPRTRWRRRGWRGCRRSSASIRRSAAAGCRNRWKPPMHGEAPKQIWAKTKGRTRRNLAILLVLIAVGAAL